MRCEQCGDEATGICVFCGSGICLRHRQRKRFITGWYSAGKPKLGLLGVAHSDQVAVPEANWCGRCKVESLKN